MYDDLSSQDKAKYVCALRAAEFVKSGMKVGLGTGSTAYWLVKHLGQSVRNGELDIVAVPTSTRTKEQAIEEGIKVVTLDEAGWLDVTIDGADEFDADFSLIKGGGGAHLQEKVVAMASDQMIVGGLDFMKSMPPECAARQALVEPFASQHSLTE